MRIPLLSVLGVLAIASYACVGDSPDGGAPGSSSSGDGGPASSSGASGGADASSSGSSGSSGGSGGSSGSGESFALTVVPQVGTGGGTVTTDVGGIACGNTCTAQIAAGTSVALTASAAVGSTFVAWAGDGAACGNQLGCTVVMDAAKSVQAVFAQNGTAGWAQRVASAGNDGNPHAARTADGGVILAASYSAALTIEGHDYDGMGNGDVIVMKLDPAGHAVWVKTLGGVGSDGVRGVAVDPSSGDVVVVGNYSADIALGGPAPLALAAGDSDDMYLVKLGGADGAFRWQRAFHGSDDDECTFDGVGVDPSGNIFVAGHLYTSLDVGGIALAAVDESRAFVGKLNGTDGGAVWAKVTSAGGSHASLDVDSAGGVVLGGSFSGTVNFGGTPLTSDGTYDGYVLRLDAAGAFAWQAPLVGTGGGDDQVYAVTVGAGDKVTAVAYVSSASVTAAGVTLTGPSGSADVVVAQYTGTGGSVWAKRFGGVGSQSAYGVSAFPDGDIVIGGGFDTTFSMGAFSVAFAGVSPARDSFFAVLAGDSGLPRWAGRAGSAAADNAFAVVASNSVFFGFGTYQQQATFFGKTLEPVDLTDVYAIAVAKP